MATETRIAVLGAGGTMGLPMARNLARAGFEVRGWNRTRELTRSRKTAFGYSIPQPRPPTAPT